MRTLWIAILLYFSFQANPVLGQRYFMWSGKVTFLSDAPLEKITATSTSLKGVIDFSARSFAFSLPVRSFKGFNSALQEEHFHENYMESEQYPVSTFTGKIIDEVNYSIPGKYPVRAKGMFTIKGISRERILKGTIVVKPNGTLSLESDFTVLLDDYSIRIPRVVYEKIAPEISVHLESDMSLEKK